jgi:hypothetical protein
MMRDSAAVASERDGLQTKRSRPRGETDLNFYDVGPWQTPHLGTPLGELLYAMQRYYFILRINRAAQFKRGPMQKAHRSCALLRAALLHNRTGLQYYFNKWIVLTSIAFKCNTFPLCLQAPSASVPPLRVRSRLKTPARAAAMC